MVKWLLLQCIVTRENDCYYSVLILKLQELTEHFSIRKRRKQMPYLFSHKNIFTSSIKTFLINILSCTSSHSHAYFLVFCDKKINFHLINFYDFWNDISIYINEYYFLFYSINFFWLNGNILHKFLLSILNKSLFKFHLNSFAVIF